VALLHDGRLARLGATADVVTPAALRETYGVDVDVVVLTREGRTVRVCVPSLERRSD
jgi:iron complex transport system ATP-binding protein